MTDAVLFGITSSTQEGQAQFRRSISLITHVYVVTLLNDLEKLTGQNWVMLPLLKAKRERYAKLEHHEMLR